MLPVLARQRDNALARVAQLEELVRALDKAAENCCGCNLDNGLPPELSALFAECFPPSPNKEIRPS